MADECLTSQPCRTINTRGALHWLIEPSCNIYAKSPGNTFNVYYDRVYLSSEKGIKVTEVNIKAHYFKRIDKGIELHILHFIFKQSQFYAKLRRMIIIYFLSCEKELSD